jgi:hypothetical protein
LGIALVPLNKVELGVALLVGAGLLFVLEKWPRKRAVVNAGRPVSEPRVLGLVDSWQTMVEGLGANWEKIRTRLYERLSDGSTPDIAVRRENVFYVSPDGKQERQQLVLSQGRGIVFCHVYQYGSDLYVGWDGYLNYGQWAETTMTSGYDPTLARRVVVNTVLPSTQSATEYDLIDVNGLIEWVHIRVTHLVRQILQEYKLDQQIDFKIVRGERQSLLRDQRRDEKAPRRRRRLLPVEKLEPPRPS